MRYEIKSVRDFIGRLALALIFLMSIDALASSTFTTEEFTFKSSGISLNGIISRPNNMEVNSIVIIVHGYGRTNVVDGNWYHELRSRFTSKGISALVWDKPGCGKSEGEFDIHQPVDSSADEVVSAIHALRKKKEAGSEQIGLWGISRAGWIAPLAIKQEPSVKFWISISGTDGFENWGYLLRSSLELSGHSPPEIDALHQGWIDGNRIFRSGGSFEDYTSATRTFWSNKIVQKLTGRAYLEHVPGSEEYAQARQQYLKNQQDFIAEEHLFDEESGLEVSVKDFDQVLKTVSCPVLAIFGGNDKHVDWRKTKKLYENTLGQRGDARLSIKVFPNADHNMRMSKTGGYLESQQSDYWKTPYADGYYEAMIEWLCSNGFCAKTE